MPWHMSIRGFFLSVDGKKDTVISKQKVIFFIRVVCEGLRYFEW